MVENTNKDLAVFANYIPPMTSNVMLAIGVAIVLVVGVMGYIGNMILRDNAFGVIGNGVLIFFGGVMGFGARLIFERAFY